MRRRFAGPCSVVGIERPASATRCDRRPVQRRDLGRTCGQDRRSSARATRPQRARVGSRLVPEHGRRGTVRAKDGVARSALRRTDRFAQPRVRLRETMGPPRLRCARIRPHSMRYRRDCGFDFPNARSRVGSEPMRVRVAFLPIERPGDPGARRPRSAPHPARAGRARSFPPKQDQAVDPLDHLSLIHI